MSTTENKPCSCTDGCCEPKKKPWWNFLLVGLIILAAVTIVAFKLINKKSEPVTPAQFDTAASCCDTTKSAADTVGKSSCCP